MQVTATGYVVAEVAAKVAAKVPGRIAEIFVKEGERIEKGQKVARLEDVDGRSGLAASRARASAARSRIQIARATLAETRVQIEREQPLVEKGVTAKATLDDLEARRRRSRRPCAPPRPRPRPPMRRPGASRRSSTAVITTADLRHGDRQARRGGQRASRPGSHARRARGRRIWTRSSSRWTSRRCGCRRSTSAGLRGVLDAYPTERFECKVKEIGRPSEPLEGHGAGKVALRRQAPSRLLPEMRRA